MPESWLNMPTVQAMMMGLRYWREKSGSEAAERSRWTEATISSSSSWGLVTPVRRRTSSASFRLDCVTSQRGLRGMTNSMTRKSTAGTPEAPNIQRQSFTPRCLLPMKALEM